MRQLTNLQVVEHVVDVSLHHYNQQFIRQAIVQWDIDGQGCFAAYVKLYAQHAWTVMAMSS